MFLGIFSKVVIQPTPKNAKWRVRELDIGDETRLFHARQCGLGFHYVHVPVLKLHDDHGALLVIL